MLVKTREQKLRSCRDLYHFPLQTSVCLFVCLLSGGTLCQSLLIWKLYIVNSSLCFSSLQKTDKWKMISSQKKKCVPSSPDNPPFFFFQIFKKTFCLCLDTSWTHDTEMHSCVCVSETPVRRRDHRTFWRNTQNKQTAGLRWQWNLKAAGSSAVGNTTITIIHPSHWMKHCQTDIKMTNDNGTVMVSGRSQPMNVYS